ncbi:MAG: hypothetical protein ACLTAF_06040 [Blautia coccoides]
MNGKAISVVMQQGLILIPLSTVCPVLADAQSLTSIGMLVVQTILNFILQEAASTGYHARTYACCRDNRTQQTLTILAFQLETV